jgi:hypothetical protein
MARPYFDPTGELSNDEYFVLDLFRSGWELTTLGMSGRITSLSTGAADA